MNLPWFDTFSIGKESPQKENYPAYAETMDSFEKVHTACIDLLRNLNDDELDKKNHLGLKFGTADTKQSIIMHSIRHEGMHCGHLSWLLRMHGRKII